MDPDVLTPWVAEASPAMVLPVKNKHLPVFHDERFPLYTPSQCWQMIGIENMFFMIPGVHLARQNLYISDKFCVLMLFVEIMPAYRFRLALILSMHV